MKQIKYCLPLMYLLVLCLVFTGCGAPAAEPTETRNPDLDVLDYAAVVSGSEDLASLDRFSNLQTLDLTGSDCYGDIEDYAASHPQVSVRYDVQIGDSRYDYAIEQLSLTPENADYDYLMEHLAYLPRLVQLDLPQTTFSAQQINDLCAAYPELTIGYTVFLLEQEIPSDVAELDLSALQPEQVDSLLEPLSKLMSVTDIYLMNADNESDLAISDVRKLMDACPDATFHYSFELFDHMVSTTDEIIELDEYIGDKREPQLREALDILRNCTYFKLDGSGISNEILAQIRDDYPNTKIVWRVSYGPNKSCFTDTTVVRCVDTLTSKNARNLKYCTEVEYADFGHCGALSDMSFVEYMPNLKLCIIGDSAVSDLTPFASCKNLEYLEIVNCNLIKDLSPLASCTNLKGLNLSYTFSVDDLSPLFGLQNLERLFMGRHDFDQEMIDAAREALPNCWVTDHAEPVAWIGFNYSVGWRLDDEETFADWYAEIMDIFGYTRTI